MERRRRLRKAEMITDLYNSPPIINEMSTNSRSVASLGEMQNVGDEISQQNLRGQSSTNITEIQKFQITTVNLGSTNQLMNILTIISK